jgi:polyisoprenoid-binding protein YceI
MSSTASTTTGATVIYEIDAAHSSAQFKIRHMMISNVRGSFAKISGTVTTEPSNPEHSTVNAEIDIASVSTNDEKRDAHLRSEDFFHVEKHPVMTFRSTNVEHKGGHEFQVRGDLTIRGVTKPVTLAVETTDEKKDPWGNQRIGATATGRVDRRQFDLNFNMPLDSGGVLVGNDVDITLEVELIRKA